jgi:hypothetical protein
MFARNGSLAAASGAVHIEEEIELAKMPAIDPIGEPAEALLSSALHCLAKASERGAPTWLGQTLSAAFRQHHRRRRRVRNPVASAIVASFVLVAC